MAGVDVEASAEFGPAWAHLRFGGRRDRLLRPVLAHISVYASIDAGITIDVWIGTITISVSLSAQVDVFGPPFHGEATFSVGPSSLTVAFGDQPPQQPAPGISWADFVPKYLQEASAGIAHVLGAITGPGAQVPAGSAADGGAHSPDGSDASPFLVTPEFTLTVTSLAADPRAGRRRHHHRPADRARGVGRADAAARAAVGHPRLHRPGPR